MSSLQTATIPAITSIETILHGSEWPSSSLMWDQPMAHCWASFCNGACPSLPPEAQLPVHIPLCLPGSVTKWSVSVLWFVLQTGPWLELQYLHGKIKKTAGSYFQNLNTNWPRFNLPHCQRFIVLNSLSVLFVCSGKSWLMLKERCFVGIVVKQGLPANLHPENRTLSLHCSSWHLFYFLLYGYFLCRLIGAVCYLLIVFVWKPGSWFLTGP